MLSHSLSHSVARRPQNQNGGGGDERVPATKAQSFAGGLKWYAGGRCAGGRKPGPETPPPWGPGWCTASETFDNTISNLLCLELREAGEQGGKKVAGIS